MKLKLGKMKREEIAQWFNISPTSYTRRRKEYLKILEIFCEYEAYKGGIIVKDIYIEEYSPNVDDDKFYLQKVSEAENHLASVSGITECAMQEKEYENLSYYQVEKRMSKAGERCFGTTKDLTSKGKYGSREYIWCIKLYDRPNHYRYLTKEEDKLFDDLIQKICNSASSENLKKIKLLEKKFKEQKGSVEEFIEARDEINKGHTFADVIREFKQRTSFQIVHATRHEIEMSIREDEDA